MKRKSLSELKKKLMKEGYGEVYEWKDSANYEYTEHKHDTDTTLIILKGEIIINIEGKSKRYVIGERANIRANKIHSAKVGSKGAGYLVGENKK